MDISAEMRKLILDEFEYVVKKMGEVDDPFQKLFYFSATFGIVQRVYNIEYNSELVFAHFILNETHKGFTARLHAIRDAHDTTVAITTEHLERLSNLIKELADKIRENKDHVDTLKKLIILTYSTTGNGFYLYNKGVLKI
jgi:hypothetical protein